LIIPLPLSKGKRSALAISYVFQISYKFKPPRRLPIDPIAFFRLQRGVNVVNWEGKRKGGKVYEPCFEKKLCVSFGSSFAFFPLLLPPGATCYRRSAANGGNHGNKGVRGDKARSSVSVR
jgi:hypothetical protein